jgi:hypothetical protein
MQLGKCITAAGIPGAFTHRIHTTKHRYRRWSPVTPASRGITTAWPTRKLGCLDCSDIRCPPPDSFRQMGTVCACGKFLSTREHRPRSKRPRSPRFEFRRAQDYQKRLDRLTRKIERKLERRGMLPRDVGR